MDDFLYFLSINFMGWENFYDSDGPKVIGGVQIFT